MVVMFAVAGFISFCLIELRDMYLLALEEELEEGEVCESADYSLSGEYYWAS